MSETTGNVGDFRAEREAKRVEELAAFAPKLAEALDAIVAQVVAEGEARTLDVGSYGSGIEHGGRGFLRLQRVVDHFARTSPVTGYVVPEAGFMGIPGGWIIVLSPRIPDPRVAALEAEVADLRARIAAGDDVPESNVGP